MKRRSVLVLASVFIALLVIALWPGHSSREPTYKGKPLSLWLADYEPGVAAPEADEAVRAIGTNCLPILLQALRVEGSGWTNSIRLPLATIDLSFEDVRNAEAVRAFEALGEEARASVPALIEIYEQNFSAASRCATAASLAAIGPPASNAIPCLLRAGTNEAPALRAAAVAALGQIHSAPQEVLPALIRSLNDAGREVQLQAAFAIARFGKNAAPAMPALIEKLQDPYNQVRGNAVWALAEAHTQPGLVVPALIRALDDPDSFVRGRAAAALKNFGADARPAKDALTHLLTDADKGVRDKASQSLQAIDSEPAGNTGPK